jgi:hypothetical protein
MINYTDQLTRLMARHRAARAGASGISTCRACWYSRDSAGPTRKGAYATCHAISIPSSEPSYYFWRDRRTGAMTRRSEWFVTKSPRVEVGSSTIDYLISFCLPRFCDQTIAARQKQDSYPGRRAVGGQARHCRSRALPCGSDAPGHPPPAWPNGKTTTRSHSPEFFRDVVEMTKLYLATRPDPELLDFLTRDFKGLEQRYGRVTGTTFRSFPSYPQRYTEVLTDQPVIEPGVRVEPVRAPPSGRSSRPTISTSGSSARAHRAACCTSARRKRFSSPTNPSAAHQPRGSPQ